MMYIILQFGRVGRPLAILIGPIATGTIISFDRHCKRSFQDWACPALVLLTTKVRPGRIRSRIQLPLPFGFGSVLSRGLMVRSNRLRNRFPNCVRARQPLNRWLHPCRRALVLLVEHVWPSSDGLMHFLTLVQHREDYPLPERPM